MELPKELGSLNDLKRREAKAFEIAMYWHDILDDVYEFFPVSYTHLRAHET